ncbi:16S rRNA (guanine(966)-N(2))-methyltransferase RsmD [Natranaerovirga hydrolytica]|uniref:16S rRNA (Guanine(966)-N(2))-methyltransferase RsmD n=1 Tax=Natranaerovirga hydrolytica TaxID=680378 RepID=A0A4R1N6Q4_9FIRM|nr:16S rRNA (guanine(966)-N(2))-methyltransferase RsmD [Natranaerovirga hydrolytica]TCK98323.1 16S rRNA (guanine(966)-N(2))-methyltransferase RsmD [Natranaerovirga hydrolytica]
MRVIAGKARRIKLIAPEGLKVRPTTDRIKETLFNIINTDIIESNFLDIFSGSGAIGIEALSRGANQAVFIDKDKLSIECIHKNLENTKLLDTAIVYNDYATDGIQKLNERQMVFDFVFMDPPYNTGVEKAVLMTLKESTLITKDTVIIIENHIDSDVSYIETIGYEITRVKQYKTNMHIFVKMKD